MLIAIDYDKTFTPDPEFWRRFISLAKEHKHTIICVTKRKHSDKIPDAHRELFALTIYCADRSKRIIARMAGMNPDIWIDNDPASVDTDFLTTF